MTTSSYIPKVGDKVVLEDESFEGMPSKEVAKLARLPYCTVESVLPIPMSDNDGSNRYIAYEIYVNETEYLVGIHYRPFKGP